MASLNPSILTCPLCNLLAPIGEFKPHFGIIEHKRLSGMKIYSIVYQCPDCQCKQKVMHDKRTFEDIDSNPTQ